MSALKASFAIYDLQIAIFEGPRLKYYLKALALQQTFPVTLKKIFDISTLIQLHKHVTSHIQVKSIRHFTSFLFFLPPHIKFGPPFYKKSFSPLQQLARGDIIFGPLGLHVLVKWSRACIH